MKVYIDAGEYYPFYQIFKDDDYDFLKDVEVPKELWRRYKFVMKEFEKLQDELRILAFK